MIAAIFKNLEPSLLFTFHRVANLAENLFKNVKPVKK